MTTKSATGINGIPLSDLKHSDLHREAGKAALRWLTARAAGEDGDIAGDIAADGASPDQLDDALDEVDALGDSALGAEIVALSFFVDDDPSAEALIVERRIGIAWGGDAAWGDLDLRGPADIDDWLHPDVRVAINDWLNDAEAWEARA